MLVLNSVTDLSSQKPCMPPSRDIFHRTALDASVFRWHSDYTIASRKVFKGVVKRGRGQAGELSCDTVLKCTAPKGRMYHTTMLAHMHTHQRTDNAAK